MPLYDYYCEKNGITMEVVHGMSLRFETWGQLCEHANLDLGDTPPDAPVERLVGGGSAVNAPVTPSKALKSYGKASTSLKNTPAMAAPPRTSKF
ncbi:MAG: zinc ribbon domain-containing protein [Pseudomonadota bacterium]|nr:zinc ribbon domain-containing protein [Pseudomonadota bacterium]